MAKSEAYKALINTSRWRNLRWNQLRLQPLCQRCLSAGRYTPATQVHHVVPVESAPSREAMAALAYDPTNLMSLCGPCHKAIHQSLATGTRSENEKRNTERAEDFNKRFLE
jgi:5-methylcytosine-specific restriction protein A